MSVIYSAFGSRLPLEKDHTCKSISHPFVQILRLLLEFSKTTQVVKVNTTKLIQSRGVKLTSCPKTDPSRCMQWLQLRPRMAAGHMAEEVGQAHRSSSGEGSSSLSSCHQGLCQSGLRDNNFCRKPHSPTSGSLPVACGLERALLWARYLTPLL